MLSYYHLETLLPRLFAFLIAMTLHDAAHAGAAWLLGDRTARDSKRLSLNPLAHLDALGLAMIIFGPYGWSKRLPVDESRFKKRPRLFHTLVYLAGPFTNLLLVLFFWWLYFFLPDLVGGATESTTVELWRVYLQYCVIVNLMICLIHMMPLYPLDGWHILKGLVPTRKQGWFARNQRYALILVIVLLITPVGQWALGHIYPFAAQFVMNLFSL
ncbi:site-2 protease family protein [Paenibacillus alginolyticus]|uniref:Site-2 protease family protein n=1 Tax=Paenibacillus alginolyticus TaxID=59839 RepID=A0ABT4GD15_9BACL|nr:site-2 protease family protein [Paenibacillus alginolyticus]MCY9694081.1 site-2 protease family protein [Paenibacillus alginolyticus]MEC0143539.1 site-2 protease family protein [Paenibacillus alginolyticus]